MTDLKYYPSKEGKMSHFALKNKPNFFLELGFQAFEKAQFISFYLKSLYLKNIYNDKNIITAKRLGNNSYHFLKNHKLSLTALTTASLLTLSYPYFSNKTSEVEIFPISEYGKIKLKELPQKIKDKFHNSFFESKNDAFIKLLTVTEGKSNTFYKDNFGIAIGYGWNLVTTPTSLNKSIIEAIKINKKETEALLEVSENRKVQNIPKKLTTFVLSDKQLKESAKVMLTYYEKDLLNVIKVKSQEKNVDFDKLNKQYHKLPYNQQAVLIHMTYKVGATNLLKYNDFFDSLFQYLEKPTDKNLEQASVAFEYSFKNRKGEYQRDYRVEQMHTSFFIDCLAIDKKIEMNLASCQKVSRDDTIRIRTSLR